MSNSKAPLSKEDTLNLAFFNLAVLQAKGLMQLSNALRNDSNVTDETRAAAESIFSNISEMLDHLDTISNTAWGTNGDE